jgi:phosphatidate cytidylyltransferase
VSTPLSKFSNLTQRIITGLAGSAAMITGLIYSEWLYFAIFGIICFFSLREFYKLVEYDGLAPLKTVGLITGMTIFVLSFLIAQQTLEAKYYFAVFPVFALMYIIKLYQKGEAKPFTNIAYTFLGLIYIVLPLVLLNNAIFSRALPGWHTVINGYCFEVILGFLLILWATDTGAYFAGTFLGKHKLFERISPKKTWEGFAGGVALAGIIAFTFYQILLGVDGYTPILTPIDWIVITIIIIIGGTFGDLVESMLKRSIAIKDSGNSIPGHGGFLDRFDGLFISAPFVVAYLEIF